MRKTAVLVAALGFSGLSALAHADNTELGKEVFTKISQPSCTICHTLSDAGSAGAIGPDLDELKPSRDQVVNAVTQGVGIMPAFEGSLSAEQVQAVADYIVSVTSAQN
ncbi:SorU family sulfite dehydrogenase c-type cytochrome subunit [Marinobacter halophilus]|uniref:Sulfide dehydrogenase n=1 Tax=Marinobacter halophilus TaxID=1323740 RepID=A0A2T1KET5_9GAMM|nr:cytochrome c [Marinobacter halophilus]PSF08625.1 sulfide dehydrogenase [Marinobacter halophilus]GGC62231.1 cytochrome c [Marinobacter halophilus]